MSLRPSRVRLATIGAAAALVIAMSVPGMAQDASPAAVSGEQPPALTPDITSYPDYGGGVDCANKTFNGSPYAGNLKSIDAPDPQTVVFTFCEPNVAFLAQIAFSALGIDDAAYLIAHGADGSILDQPNGTGPYQLASWEKGNRMVLTANPSHWGDAALTPNVEFRWSDQSAQRLTELLSGTVDGIDNPGKDDMPTIEGNADLTLYPRAGLNTFYLGFNNTVKPFDDAKVRQAIAMGIDRQRIVDNFYPTGSEVATYFTPCGIPLACQGEEYYAFDPAAAKALLAEAGYPDGFQTKLQLRNAVRGYLPDPPTVAQEIQSQLKNNLGIDAEIEIQESGTFLDNNAAGTLDGIFMLGWGADYPDPTNFLDYHFGKGAGKKFGTPNPQLVDLLSQAGQSADDATREQLYTQANDLIKETVPAVFIAHGASAAAFKADVEGAHSSPLTSELFSVMKAGDRDALVWMQNAEPLSLYCADETDGETLRACEQIKESLYSYEIGGTASVPSLATECTKNEDATVWTCALRDGVTFQDGSTFDAGDVIVSYAAQWDAASPLHKGRTGAFEYWPALIGGGFLNPPQ
jgi:peptide/nickel transport system substrate-binding protein